MNPLQIALAALIAAGFPIAFLALIYALDVYASRFFRLVVLCFAWGAVGGLGLAYVVNTYISLPLLDRVRLDHLLLYLILAPVTEEIAKSLPLFYIYRRPEFTYFVDGAIYGFAAGIGFSITENFLYMSERPDVGIPLVLARAFSTCLMHGAATALIGAAVGRFRFQRGPGRRLLLVSGWIAAFLIHALFNSAVVAFRVSASLRGIAAMGIGLGGLGVVVLFIFLGLREERKWLIESLDEKLFDLVRADLAPQEQEWLAEILDREGGVTPAEVRASQVYEALDGVLQPIARKFPRKAELVTRVVLQQAQIGIKRRVWRELGDPELQEQLMEEIDRLQEDTKRLRREAGVCAMTYIQCVFAEEGADVMRCVEEMVACAEGHDHLSGKQTAR